MGDLITGLRRIADFIGEPEGAVRRLARDAALPVIEIGGEMVMSREAYFELMDQPEAAIVDED